MRKTAIRPTQAGRVIIKMDIEGAEWDALLATSDEFFSSISQITMKCHGYNDPKILEVLRKLKRNFYLVNLHFNNWSCTSAFQFPEHLKNFSDRCSHAFSW